MKLVSKCGYEESMVGLDIISADFESTQTYERFYVQSCAGILLLVGLTPRRATLSARLS